MKLRRVLILAFITLTLVPAVVILLLLYKSGLELSKESYTRNLMESINVQADYLSQSIESNMITDSRFLSKLYKNNENPSGENQKDELFSAFQNYLENAEDRVATCILLDQNNTPLYTIGEADTLKQIQAQLPNLPAMETQIVKEFSIGSSGHSLSIITPIHAADSTYLGTFISIYDKSYLFKSISSYYGLVDTSIYICSEKGEIINLKGFADKTVNTAVEKELQTLELGEDGPISIHSGNTTLTGYYKNIYNAPWYLAGVIDQAQIYAFTNQFILIYVLIIILIIIADVALSVYFSQKVVEPINHLIQLMDGYPDSINNENSRLQEKRGYYETRYLRTKFLSLMKTIMRVQHNFEGIYQLYQSNDMGDTNIDINVISQTIHSSKSGFAELISGLVLPPEACIVERFTRCFCDKDQLFLMNMFEGMRDEHLSITREAEVFTPYFNQKWFHILVVPMYEQERLSRLFIQLRDITSFKKQEYESMEQAKRDSLTGLLNRSGFISSVDQACSENLREAQHGVLFLDMNNFKLVNDNFGHSEGDKLLHSVADVLNETVAPNHIVSRFGGDEFAIFMPCTSLEKVEHMRETLNQRLIFPYKKEDFSFIISASIGSSIWNPSSGSTLNDLINEADTAMYQVKREHKRNELNSI